MQDEPMCYASGYPPSLAHPAAQDSTVSYSLMGEPSFIYMIANQRERCKREQPGSISKAWGTGCWVMAYAMPEAFIASSVGSTRMA